VTRGTARGLDERGFAAQEAFFVGIEDADEADLGQIEAFAEEIDADEHIAVARAQAAQDFDALDGVDVAVQVADFEVEIAQVVGQVLRRALRERGDEHALALFDALAAQLDGFVDLAFERLDGDDGIEQAGRADDLLDDQRSGLWW
jgi:hypothetical protein